MATYTVTTLADVVDASDGKTSLREAIDQANLAAGADTITFSVGGKITLSSTLNVTDALTIDGDIGGDHTADVTIDGGGSVQLLNAGADLTVIGLVLTNGHSALEGGAISTTGALTITDSSLSGNTALSDGGAASAGGNVLISNSILNNNKADNSGGAISAGGTLVISDSSLTNNTALSAGGAAYAGGDVTLTGSTVAGNSGNHGGGINTVGSLTATDTTLSGNTATGLGGGVSAAMHVDLANTTVSGNTALIGGGVSTFDTFTATNSTFSGNVADASAGAVKAVSGITVTNSIFLGDAAASAESELDGATTTFKGLNIVGTGADTGTSDHVINAASVSAVFVTDGSGNAVLADNGGPVETIALVDAVSNPALDASDALGTAADARGAAAFDRSGVANAQGSARDLGAYEYTDPPATYVVTNLNDSGAGSLRDAIAQANAHFGADTITFAAGLTGGTITLTSTLQVTDAVTINGDINGDHKADVTISGNNAVQILHSTADLTVQGLVLTHGLSSANGAAVYAGVGTLLTITDSQLISNSLSSDGVGGGAYSGGDLIVAHSTFSGNSAGSGGFGGGAYANHNLTVTNSTFSGNTSKIGGGAYSSGNFTATNSTFSGNTAASSGGGARATDVVITNSTFSGNSASIGGGVTSLNNLTSTDSILLGNSGQFGPDVRASEAPIYLGLNIIGIGTDTDKSDHVINASSLGAVFVLGSDGKPLLADNGGLVKSIKLVNSTTNPALDASDPSAPANDARGVSAFDNLAIANAQGGARDLGAYELAAANVLPALTLTKTSGDFTNATKTSTAIKVATIALTDPDSTPSLSLAGPDAGLFQIKGNALYLKAGAKLDGLNNPSLDVTVRADDPANGTGVDVGKSLSFKLTPIIKGTSSSDTLVGSDFNDTIYGLDGSDLLTGLGGRDVLIGGKGADTFVYKALSDSKLGNSLHDVISGFTHGQDRIDLRLIDANTKTVGNQAFTFIGLQAFHKAAGELHAVVSDAPGTINDKTIVQGDVNGDGKADFEIVLTGLPTLTSTDFFL